MRLDGEHAKNGQPRVFPFSELPPFRDLLYRHRAKTETVEKGRKVEYVLHRRRLADQGLLRGLARRMRPGGLGHTVKGADGRKRNVAHRIVHDFRRGAVHRLEWAGVPRETAMKLTGHETSAISGRYSISRGKDLPAGVARVADYVETLNGSVQESSKEPVRTIEAQRGRSRK